MILVDTSVWIDFFRQSDTKIDELLTSYLEMGEIIAISAVFGELLQGAGGEMEEKMILEFWENLPKVEEELFIEAGKLSNQLKLTTRGVGLIDSYILAAVKLNKLTLWTLDKKLVQIYNTIQNSKK